MKNRSTLTRIYRLKVVIIGLVLLLLGLAAAALGDWLSGTGAPAFAVALIKGLSDALIVSGAIGIAIDLFTAQEKEAADTDRIRRLLKEAAPDFRDAVISGFADTPETMRGVATTETLDKLATNALALRLGDEKFASEIYDGLLAQAIRTPERWSDVDINVRLSCMQERGTVGASRSSLPDAAFNVVVTWEYTLVPSTRIQRFASTDDVDEFHEFLDDVPATSAWYIPVGLCDPKEKEAFEVLAYSVNGEDRPIRRTVRKHGQTYSVDLGERALLEAKPVRLRQVYRTVVDRPGHRFRVTLTQPSHGMRLVLDYTETDIAVLKVGDMISSATPAQVKFLPDEAPAKQVEVSVPGWLLPQAEVTFVWTLSAELGDEARLPHSRAA